MNTPQWKEIHRTPWPMDFPDIVIHTTVEVRDAHPCYKAAKAQDGNTCYIYGTGAQWS
ncbi:MAG: hypothetical protein HQK92_07540 [Nitrospirae bacterium]|nr:hypothetical protein [Nitrospirota bacterium]